MAETNKTPTVQTQSTDKTMLIVVIVFGSIIALLLAYIAIRVTIGPRHPQLKSQIQQRQQLQRGVRLNNQSLNQSQSDPMNFDEETNLN